MSENPIKLKLKSTDTNRFKVESDKAAEGAAAQPAAANPVQPPKPTGISDPSATQSVADPISLRDTATGRLKKLSEDKTGTAASLSGSTLSNKTPGAIPLRIVPQDNKASDTTNAPAPAASNKPTSSTIKLAIKKPGAANAPSMTVTPAAPSPAPAAPAPAPAAPAPTASAPAPAAPAQPAAVGSALPSDSSTLKIRPAGSSEAKAAPAPAPVVPNAEGRKPALRLKKEEPAAEHVTLPPGAAPAPDMPPKPAAAPEPAPAPASAATPATPASDTQANAAAKTQAAPSASATTSAKLLKAQARPNFELNAGSDDASNPGTLAAVSAILATLAGAAAIVFAALVTINYIL